MTFNDPTQRAFLEALRNIAASIEKMNNIQIEVLKQHERQLDLLHVQQQLMFAKHEVDSPQEVLETSSEHLVDPRTCTHDWGIREQDLPMKCSICDIEIG